MIDLEEIHWHWIVGGIVNNRGLTFEIQIFILTSENLSKMCYLPQ